MLSSSGALCLWAETKLTPSHPSSSCHLVSHRVSLSWRAELKQFAVCSDSESPCPGDEDSGQKLSMKSIWTALMGSTVAVWVSPFRWPLLSGPGGFTTLQSHKGWFSLATPVFLRPCGFMVTFPWSHSPSFKPLSIFSNFHNPCPSC